jgi:hypothetical protein
MVGPLRIPCGSIGKEQCMNATTKLATAAAAAVLMISTAGATGPDGFGHRHGRSIVGVWLMEVTLTNCATGAPIGVPPFKAINTFHEGGTLSEHGARFGPATRNNGQGVWKQVGRNRYSSRFIFQRFDANGLYIGTQEINRISTLSDDGKTTSTTATVRIVDQNDVLLVTGCATEEGTRF